MLRNYLKIAYRNLLKHRAYSFINILGMAIGFACFILISLFVQHEWSYDRYHPQAENIYRIGFDISATEGLQRNAQSPAVFSKLLPGEFPEIEEMVRFKPPRQTWMIRNEEKDQSFTEKKFAFADSNVFKLFKIPLLQGNATHALKGPNSMVISESAAAKYFPGEDAMGKNLVLDNQYQFSITGIIEDFPQNSHFNFDFLASFESLRDSTKYYLFNVHDSFFPFVYTYLRLKDGVDPAALESRFPAFVDSHFPQFFRPQGTEIKPYLQPLTDIHLHSKLENEIEPNADAATITIFVSIALFILIIACVNFMNLATARSSKRAKEVGMRKVMGAQKGNIIFQFMGETLMMVFIALVISFGMVYLALPAFNQISGKSFVFLDAFNLDLVILLLIVTFITGFLSGSYPSLAIAAIKPSEVLKSAQQSGTGGQALLRKVLIVFQFAISIFLVIGTMVVYNQMKYAQNQNFGLDREEVLVVQLTDPTPMSLYKTFKKSILEHPNVLNVSASFSAPATLVQQARMKVVNSGTEDVWQSEIYFGDFDMVETLGIELLAGRTILPENPGDTLLSFVINETAVKTFGFESNEDALGRQLQFAGAGPGANNWRIIGVIKDFHSMSVREEISPILLSYATQSGFFAFIRLRLDEVDETISWIGTQWNEIVPGYTFDYSFLDQDFNKLYKGESILNQLLTYFSGLAIFIACLGLFGLISFTTTQRAKEIGIRKVMGSSITEIVLLLSKDFTKLVLIGFFISSPIAYYVMDNWLRNFAFHTDVGVTSIIIAGISALVAAWITVGYQTVRAAAANPVSSLKSE